MAVPKRRTSASKRNMRRAANSKIVVPNVVVCSQCGEPMIPHRVCPSCGYYDGKQIVAAKKSAE